MSLFSIKFSFEWVYFWAGKPRECSSVYIEKIVKKHLLEDITILRWRVCLATKISINFFVRNKVLNIFHLTIFSKQKKNKKNNIFQKTAKIIFFLVGWGNDHFSENGASEDKNDCNLFYRKWSTEHGFEMFSSKNHILTEWKSINQFWRNIFPHISGSITPIVSKKR